MFNWNYNLAAKGSQKATEKKDDIVVTNKQTEFALKINIKGKDENIDDILSTLAEETDGIESCSLTLVGTEETLKTQLKQISKLIAKAGGQETLDIHLGEKIKA